MIRNDHPHAERICQCDLGCRCNSVIAGHDHTDTFSFGLFDQMLVQSIAVMDSVGNSRVHLSLQHLKTFGQNIGRTDSIHIIIPDDPDMQPFPYRF